MEKKMNENENITNQNEEVVEKIIDVDLVKEMRKAYLDYSMSVLVGRALPDVRDGLKPVHRRILYTYHEDGLTPDKPYRKCADTVGAVLGRYHPHGDAAVYDSIVRLAQDFSLRYMLVDGHGNFGSIDGHPAAAYRYTESRMSKIATHMLADIDKETVDFAPNYDDRLKEPLVLPSKFPNLLVNGSTGIAVGMATNIPPHNLKEVVDAVCALIDNPDIELDEIMEYIKGPDFPTGGIVMGRAGIRAAYATGKGKIIVRGKAEIEEDKNGKCKIIISEIPYMVNKSNLVKSIVDLVNDKRIDGIADIVDHSSKDGMRIVVDLKSSANPQVVLNKLYSYTQLQTTFGAIMIALVNGEPKTLSLKEMITHYINFQRDVIERRTRYELRKAKEREHILEGLKKAIDIIDDIIETLKKSKNVAEGKEALIENFGFDEVQAAAIVAMRLGQLTGLEREKIENELGEIRALIAEYTEILSNPVKRDSIIKEEMTAISDKYSDERRTEITAVSGEVDIEDLIPVEDCIITLTSMGYIKRLPVDVYKAQNRGGRGIMGMTRRDEDFARYMFIGNSHDYIMFFTNFGRVYRLKCYEIPEGSRTSKGMNVVNLLPFESGEKVSAMIKVSEFEEGKYLCMVTKHGIIKRTLLNAYNTARKGGIIAVDLDEGDELSEVKMTDGSEKILVATHKGMAICFDENDARCVGRTARGVRAIKLADDDYVVGMAIIRDNAKILTITETGYGRQSDPSDYRVQNRGGKGITNYKVQKYGDVAGVKVVDDTDDIIVITSDGIVIRTHVSQIRECARPSKGVKIMRVNDGEKVATLARAVHEDDVVDDAESPTDDNTTESAETTEE
jgi:DNA gyrase subunit A